MQRRPLLFLVVPIVGIGAIVYSFWNPPWTPLRIIGLILLAFGLIFLTVARLQLGNSFSIKPEARKLVTHGLYSKIRNPVYFFGVFVFTGLILYIGQSYLLLLMIPLVLMQVLRARAEARVLEEKFGDEYRAYRAKTWF